MREPTGRIAFLIKAVERLSKTRFSNLSFLSLFRSAWQTLQIVAPAPVNVNAQMREGKTLLLNKTYLV